MSNPVLKARQVSRTFEEGDLCVEVLKNIEITIEPGEQVAIIGSSGAGKSTLLHLLGGLDKPTSGTVQLDGTDFFSLRDATRSRYRNKYLGFVYQFHHLLPEFTALENVAMPLFIAGRSEREAKLKANNLLTRVGLSERLNHKPGELSGGERQRTAVARALVNDPACVLADEPTGNLDDHTASNVLELLRELNQELNTSLVIVTHDHDIAARMQKTYVLKEGTLKLSNI